ncbi:hypothetical protein CR205_04210 [Alteribacter lacisalsi]|uniref:Uncharacterized protein n=1 Tax=Alteribacter lacisalsi TaxID=2045244 RepID=A0A2W0HJX1_9BACI|nr:hypothetical protein [Alteribacter lacisalsi]PYZ97805.1 hypothetical protein CR205_04210 [Alteribacter lacisalsi]
MEQIFWNVIGLVCLGLFLYERTFAWKTRGVFTKGEPVTLVSQTGSLLVFSSYLFESFFFLATTVIVTSIIIVVSGYYRKVIQVKNGPVRETLDTIDDLIREGYLPFDDSEKENEGKKVTFTHSASNSKLTVRFSKSVLNDNFSQNALLQFTKNKTAYDYKAAEEEFLLKMREQRGERTFYRQSATCMLLVLGFSAIAFFITGPFNIGG